MYLLRALRTLSIALACSIAAPCLAQCPPARFDEPSQVRITGQSVLVVVHASSAFDSRVATKRGVDEAVSFAKRHRIPVIYMQDDTAESTYFAADCAPDYRVRSQGGEVAFDLGRATHVYIAGGHLELCMSTALHEMLLQWSRRPAPNLRVTYFMDAVYSNGKLIDPSDPFYGDFDRFLSIVTYGRPGGEQWPKLTLLETMGIIRREDHELEYIRQALPRWDRTFPPAYRVDVRLNDSVAKVLRPAPGWHPPTLSFHFVDSALGVVSPECLEAGSPERCAP